MDLFWSKGYEATGLAELCDHMGVGRQSLYNCFGDKEALFQSALQRYARTELQPLIELLRGPGSGLANVHRVLDMWAARAEERCRKGCLLANSIAEFGMREPKLAKTLRVLLRSMEDAFRDALERAAAAGELPAGQDPRSLARLLTAIGQGLSTAGKLDPSGSFAREAVAAARAMLP
jgi:TetR/AcrR family transcriptional repressor of nem operon